MTDSEKAYGLNPFPGPVALDGRHPVFGRDEELANLRSLLIAEQVVVLHGVSGAGKSSLLRGANGIRERLTSEAHFSVLGPIELRLPSHSGQKTDSCERILLDLLNKEEPVSRQRETEEIMGDLDLEMFLVRRANKLGCTHQLVIIDQFEDVFTRYQNDEAAKTDFFTALGKAVESNSNLRLLIAMREEFLGELEQYRRFMPGRFQARQRLELLRKPAAVAAICKTAAHHEAKLELCQDDVYNLVEHLSQVADVVVRGERHTQLKSGTYVEPLLLQLACRKAWSDVIKAAEAHQHAGCVPIARGWTRTQLDDVIGQFYREALAEVCAKTLADEYKLRVLFQDTLISSAGLRSLVDQKQILDDLGLDGSFLGMLEDKHLIRLHTRNMLPYIELAHDQLVEPIRLDNNAWLDNAARPGWRTSARQNRLGRRNASMSYPDLIEARRTRKKTPGMLMAYEEEFICEQEQLQIKRPLKQILLISAAAAVILTWSAIEVKSAQNELDDLRRESEVLENKVASLVARSDTLTNHLDKREEKIENQKSEAEVRREIAKYVESKWSKRDDQLAAMDVVKSKTEADKRFPDEKGRPFHASLFSAYNNVLKERGAPGYSRSLRLFGAVAEPLGFSGGAMPMMVHVRDDCVVITNLRLGTDRDSCVIHVPDMKVRSLAFLGQATRLMVHGEKSSALITLHPEDPTGGESGNMATTIEPIVAEVEAYALSEDGGIFVFSANSRVTLLCATGLTWHRCGDIELPLNNRDKATALAISLETTGSRYLALGTKHGDVITTALQKLRTETAGELRQWTRAASPVDRLTVNRTKGGEEVLALRFPPELKNGLLVVHKDARFFRIDIDGRTPDRYARRTIIPDVGSQSFGVGTVSKSPRYTSAMLTPDGRMYAVLDDEIENWDLRKWPSRPDGDLWLMPVARYETGARNLAHLAVGSHYLLGKGYFAVWAWDIGDRGTKLVLDKFSEPPGGRQNPTDFYPQALAFTPFGGLVTGSTSEGLTHSSQAADGAWTARHLGSCHGGAPTAIRALALSRDGQMVAAAGALRQLIVAFLDAPEMTPWCDDKEHNDGLWAVAFSSDQRWLVSGEWDDNGGAQGNDPDTLSKLLLWRVAKAPEKRISFAGKIWDSDYEIRSVAFHPKQNLVAAGNAAGEIRLYRIDNDGNAKPLDAASGAPLLTDALRPPRGVILDLSFSEDGRFLAAADSRGPIHYWEFDLAMDGEVRVKSSDPLEGHGGGTRALAFHPKRALLATGGADNLLRIWDLDRPSDAPAILRSVDAGVLDVAWDKAGDHLAASFKASSNRIAPEAEFKPGVIVILSWNLAELQKIACDSIWPAAWTLPNPCDAGQLASEEPPR